MVENVIFLNLLANIQSRAGKGLRIMPYIAPEVVQEAKRMDLLTYLKNYEPYELVHFSGNTYTTKTHDSLNENLTFIFYRNVTSG